MDLEPGARVTLRLPGGGGYGDPLERETDRVLADVVDGYVSIDAARDAYGVVITYDGPPSRRVRPPALYRIDEQATAALRQRLREPGVRLDDEEERKP